MVQHVVIGDQWVRVGTQGCDCPLTLSLVVSDLAKLHCLEQLSNGEDSTPAGGCLTAQGAVQVDGLGVTTGMSKGKLAVGMQGAARSGFAIRIRRCDAPRDPSPFRSQHQG